MKTFIFQKDCLEMLVQPIKWIVIHIPYTHCTVVVSVIAYFIFKHNALSHNMA